ncbi:hypothetical protein FACHB389_06800 [Nostoc calcicola FACHB-389]|nr:hypothetical protein [Nostoc calcicola FACHB-3891]OKH40706.1 hypothetical protein FACHB389_06800 [Nostoc calcicola FACHB-389]
MNTNDRYQAHYQALVNNGVPSELAAKASQVTANETPEQPRTQEQQQVVTEAWGYLNRHFQQMESLEDEPTLHDS